MLGVGWRKCFMLAAVAVTLAESGTLGFRMQEAGGGQGDSRLEVRIRDRDTRRSVYARIYLTDAKGKTWAPPGAITYDRGNEHHFISTGTSTVSLPPGDYSLTAERGTEYSPTTRRIRLSPGERREETLVLSRWVRMNERRWYSGDLHVHRSVQEIPALMLAEDLNLAPAILDWIWEDRQVARPLKTVDAIRTIDATHAYSVLDKEVERLEAGPGAVDLLALKSPIPFEGYRLYPPSSVFCKAAHDQDGFVDAEKIVWRDVAALVALGHVDFAGIVHNHFNRQDVLLETDRWGMIPKERPEFNTVAGMPLWAMAVYYRFLNCGFRLPVSAGSASGVMSSPLGYNRVYVKMDGAFDYVKWYQNLKAGRNFATNGPMLFLTVDGLEPGATIRKIGSNPARLRIRVESESLRPVDRLEVVSNGQVIKTVKSTASARKLSARFEIAATQSGWIAARCFEPAGTTIRFAHTSPVYVDLDKLAIPPSEDVQFFIDWIDREIEHYTKLEGFKEAAHRAEMLAFFRSAREVYAKMLPR